MIDEKTLDELRANVNSLLEDGNHHFSMFTDEAGELIRLARLGFLFERILKDRSSARLFIEAVGKSAAEAQDEYILSAFKKP